MNNKFDELAKGLAQSVTRRGALKKFSLGLAGTVLAALGLTNKAEADPACLPQFSPCKPNGPKKCCPPNACLTLGSSKIGICARLT